MQFFVVEREVIVANLRKTKLLSLLMTNVKDVLHKNQALPLITYHQS